MFLGRQVPPLIPPTELTTDTRDLPLTAIRQLTLSEQIRDMLRDRIIAGDLAPGEKLTEIDLAKRLDVSRGPLREAIMQLTQEGLLVKAPYKGLRVRSVSQIELRELYSIRTALERFAFEEAWPHRTEAALKDLKARFAALEAARERRDLTASVEGEVAFHTWVYDLSGHGLLQDHWRKLIPLVQIYMSLHQNLHGVSGVFMSANAEYLKLAAGDDLAPMLDHIGQHMQQGMDEVYASVPAAAEQE